MHRFETYTGLRPWSVVCLAFRDLGEPRQLLIRVTIVVLIVLSETGFLTLHDLGNGIMHDLDRRTPPSDEFINRVHVASATNGGTLRWITQDEICRLRDLQGVKDATFYQELSRFEFRDVDGQARSTTVVSVSDGSPSLAEVASAARDKAKVGLIYLHGRPFRADENDKAGVIVTRQWLQEQYWRGSEADVGRDYPKSITFRLPALPRVSKELAGWNGLVRIPVVGVVEHPSAVIEERRNDVEHVFFPEGFMARIARWRPHWAFVYPTVDGQPMAENTELVTSIRITSSSSGELKEDIAGLRTSLEDPFYPISPVFADGSITLKLDLTNRPDQLVDRPMAQARMKDAIELLSRAGCQPLVAFETKRSSELASPLGPIPEPELARGFIRFKHLDHVLPGAKNAELVCPDLRYFVRYQQSIDTYRTVRFVVENAACGLNCAFGMATLFVLGMLAHLHVSAKTRDAAILRLRGESLLGVGRLFFVQLAMLVLPACLFSQVLAWCAANCLDRKIASQLVPSGSSELSSVFASVQPGTPALENWVSALVILWVVAVLALATTLAMYISRRSIAEGLRAA